VEDLAAAGLASVACPTAVAGMLAIGKCLICAAVVRALAVRLLDVAVTFPALEPVVAPLEEAL
jgi:hypothetical protein